MVGAGLQRHVGGGADNRVTSGCGVAQGHDFCVGAAGGLGVALAEKRPRCVEHHASYSRIGVRFTPGLDGQCRAKRDCLREIVSEHLTQFYSVEDALQPVSDALVGVHTLTRPVIEIITIRVWLGWSAAVKSFLRIDKANADGPPDAFFENPEASNIT